MYFFRDDKSKFLEVDFYFLPRRGRYVCVSLNNGKNHDATYCPTPGGVMTNLHKKRGYSSKKSIGSYEWFEYFGIYSSFFTSFWRFIFGKV